MNEFSGSIDCTISSSDHGLRVGSKTRVVQKNLSLAQLTAIWDKKLAKAGFVDIEHKDPKTGRFSHLMRTASGAVPKAYSPENAEFYRLASRYFHVAPWKRKKCVTVNRKSDGLCYCLSCKRIWELFSEGFNQTEIASMIKKMYRFKVIRCTQAHIRAIARGDWDPERNEEEDGCKEEV